MDRKSAFIITWLSCMLGLAGVGAGEVPTSLSAYVSQPSLDQQDTADIKEYTAYYLDLLANGDHEAVMKARAKLVEPMKNIRGNASSAFRSTYADSLIPTLEDILDGPDVYRGVNAIQIAGFLGTDSSIRMLERRAGTSSEPNASRRLWIAIAMRESMNSGELSLRSYNAAARGLADAAEEEEDWRVLMRQLETISSMAKTRRTSDEGGEDLRSIGRELQLRIIKGTLDRILASDDEEVRHFELIQALRPSIFDVQQQYLDPELMQYRREVGLNMAPQLARVYDVILLHGDALRNDEELSDCCGLSLRLSNETLRLIEADLGSDEAPDLEPEKLWKDNDTEALREGREAWKAILTKSPYNGR